MINLIICDTGALTLEFARGAADGIPALEGVVPDGNKTRARDSLGAYLALFSLCPLVGFGELRAILRDEYGKPHDSRSGFDFSISHRGGIAALLLSDEGAVGVDIEVHLSDERIERVGKRFLSGFSPEEGEPFGLSLCFARLDELGKPNVIEKISDIDNNYLHIESISPKKDNYSAWTAMESLLKLSGRGFGDYTRLSEISEASRVLSYRFEYKGFEYTLSLAKYK